jgi:hypothetical protein
MKHFFIKFNRQLIAAMFVSAGIISLQAQEKTIHVTESGGVSALLTENEKANTVTLTVTTAAGVQLNNDDFTALNALPKLKELDLSGDANTTLFPDNAFMNNASIEIIRFPANLTGFGAGTFNGSALKGVVSFPATITNPSYFTSRFDNCQGITGFDFPDNTALNAIDGVIIGWGNTIMKYPCGKTDEAYTLPEGIINIAQQAFGDNHRLKKLVLSSTFTTFINEGATFRNTDSLEEYGVHPDNVTYGAVDGLLYKKATKALCLAYPPGKTDETLVIDGSLVTSIPQGYFSSAVAYLKSVIFTEGVEEIGYIAFKIGNNVTSVLEYIELPSTITTINGEAFVGNGNLLQIICKATTPPTLLGNQIFRESNSASVRLGVPAESVEDYRTSSWNRNNNSEQNCFTPDQIVAYRSITVANATASQEVCVPGFRVKITAGEGPAGQSFSGWTSEPEGVEFISSSAATTYFTMPDNDVTIRATFSVQKPYTVIGATKSQSGEAAVGSSVDLETDAQKVVDGVTLYFQRWQINEGAGQGLIVGNPSAVSTSFVMIDGDVEIEAIYKAAYMVNISGGSAPELDYFEGDVVTITATGRPEPFDKWTTTTPGVEFADETASTTTFVMPASEVNITATFKTGTGINNVDRKPIAAYPNPATSYILLPGIAASAYTIYDTAGTAVAQGITEGETIAVDALKAGIYTLRIGKEAIRFIKK